MSACAAVIVYRTQINLIYVTGSSTTTSELDAMKINTEELIESKSKLTLPL